MEERNGFGVDVRLSLEPVDRLETGGGLMHARAHFRRDAPFFLHNVDVISGADLEAMYDAHTEERPLATLAVSQRESSRVLRFDPEGLQARVDLRDGRVDQARAPAGPTRDWAFDGVHVLSPDIFDLVTETGAFSIMDPYLRLAGAGHRIVPHDITGSLWLEIGDPERLERARRIMRAESTEGGAA